MKNRYADLSLYLLLATIIIPIIFSYLLIYTYKDYVGNVIFGVIVLIEILILFLIPFSLVLVLIYGVKGYKLSKEDPDSIGKIKSITTGIIACIILAFVIVYYTFVGIGVFYR